MSIETQWLLFFGPTFMIFGWTLKALQLRAKENLARRKAEKQRLAEQRDANQFRASWQAIDKGWKAIEAGEKVIGTQSDNRGMR